MKIGNKKKKNRECLEGNHKMKLSNGKKWYLEDINNYTPEYLCEIIIDLHKKLKSGEKIE
jgi:hypothetical protein